MVPLWDFYGDICSFLGRGYTKILLWFRNPAPVEVGSVSHHLQGFIHARYLGLSFQSTNWLSWWLVWGPPGALGWFNPWTINSQAVLCDLFGMVKTWRFQRFCDLQLGDKKVTAWITCSMYSTYQQHPTGQISSRPKTRVLGPQMVVIVSVKPPAISVNLGWWNMGVSLNGGIPKTPQNDHL